MAALSAGAGTYQQTVRKLAQQFPALRGRALTDAASYAYNAAGRAGRQVAPVLSAALPTTGARANSDLAENNRYSARVSWTDPITGQARSFGVIIDSTHPLSYDEIREKAEDDVRERYEDDPHYPQFGGGAVPDDVRVSIVYQSVKG